MSELLPVGQEKTYAATLYSRMGKTEKAAATDQSGATQTSSPAVSESLSRLMFRLNQTLTRFQERRQLLLTGESTLAEVRENLGRMAELAQTSAFGDAPERAALQEELRRLSGEIDRLFQDSSSQGTTLFRSGNEETIQVCEMLAKDIGALSRTLFSGSAGETTLPAWLLEGMTQTTLDRSAILSSLGLDEHAKPEDILKALGNLEDNPTAGRLAALYLGAVIAGGGTSPEQVNMTAILEGLQRLLEKVADGVPLDQAIQDLTHGNFSGLLDFELHFQDGTQELADFLAQLLFPEEETTGDLSALPSGLSPGGIELALDGTLDLQMDLLQLDLLFGVASLLPSGDTGKVQTERAETTQFGNFQVMGKNLSGVSFDLSTGVLTLDGAENVTVLGTVQTPQTVQETASASAARVERGILEGTQVQDGQETPSIPENQAGQKSISHPEGREVEYVSQTGTETQSLSGTQAASRTQSGRTDVTTQTVDSSGILIAGSGTVTLQHVSTPSLVLNGAEVRLLSVGENAADVLLLQKGASAVLSGSGSLETGALRGENGSQLLLNSGTLSVDRGNGKIEGELDVRLDGPASLAVQGSEIKSMDGMQLESHNILWKNLPSDWEYIVGLSVDGKAERLDISSKTAELGFIRLWLSKGEPDSSHGYPFHTVRLYGRDKHGQLRTQYTYVQWEERTRTFREVVRYPNPFTVEGGEEGADWTYDAATQSLQILTAQVSKVSGGLGVDADENLFSGRITLSNQIGELELTLSGVHCHVSSGRAFDLGRENEVTLLLDAGSANIFVSGTGCAGLSLGDGTSVRIDAAPQESDEEEELPVGSLTCVGGMDGAGIGRDSCGGWDRISRIQIDGGSIVASGGGAGAGIGAGKHGFMGPVTINGGSVTATGGPRGGAGIGGALGAPVGDITIRGGIISAQATYHAAAIGAGIQGESGDIRVTGTARIARAEGGDPDADIGACLFGKCGEITISGGAEIGSAAVKRWMPEGVRLELDNKSITLPQLSLSAGTLLLNQLDISTQEGAWAAQGTIYTAGRRVERAQSAYHTLNRQLEQNLNELMGAHAAIRAAQTLVRDTGEAGTLLTNTKRSILRESASVFQGEQSEIWRLLR